MEKRLWEFSVVTPQISLQSDREAIVEGDCQIIDYDEDMVLLKVNGRCIRFWGSRLVVSSLSQEYLIIRGKLMSLEFLDPGDLPQKKQEAGS